MMLKMFTFGVQLLTPITILGLAVCEYTEWSVQYIVMYVQT